MYNPHTLRVTLQPHTRQEDNTTMLHKCFISSKNEDAPFRSALAQLPIDITGKPVDALLNSRDEDYVMQKIREDNLLDSTITIYLIGTKSAEIFNLEDQKYSKEELKASLYSGDGLRNGILGVVLPSMYEQVYKGQYDCNCGMTHNIVNISPETTIDEFCSNYYPKQNKCFYTADDGYCVLVAWKDFIINPNAYIEQAFVKRIHPIAEKITVYA